MAGQPVRSFSAGLGVPGAGKAGRVGLVGGFQRRLGIAEQVLVVPARRQLPSPGERPGRFALPGQVTQGPAFNQQGLGAAVGIPVRRNRGLVKACGVGGGSQRVAGTAQPGQRRGNLQVVAWITGQRPSDRAAGWPGCYAVVQIGW
jgi:hypothetical protein